VCDHSNAMYVPWIRDVPHVVTCHDLIAVRRALGDFPGERTSWTGRRLQRAIRRGLQGAARIVCDSEATRQDVRRLVRSSAGDAVIFPGVAPAFRPMTRDDADARVTRLGLPRSFLLHVGGSQWYKNRAGLLDLYAALVTRLPSVPPLVLVGKPLTPAETGALAAGQLRDRVVTAAASADEDLAALYSAADVLLFPSIVEGFGWPVLEAMACGCRVVTSDRAPMTEVGGEAATYINPRDPSSAAAIVDAVLREPASERHARITAGLARAARFSSRAMADAYLAIYRDAHVHRSDAA
jgi:glycosyltransferase involved in cell wall biosynthesis